MHRVSLRLFQHSSINNNGPRIVGDVPISVEIRGAGVAG